MAFAANDHGILATGHETGAGSVAILANFNLLASRAPKCNYSATTNPSSANNSSQQYWVGSLWLNTSTSTLYRCIASNGSAATWQSYSLAGHTHVVADVTGLQAALDAKQAASGLGTAAFVNTGTTSGTLLLLGASGAVSLPGTIAGPGGTWNVDTAGNAVFNGEVDAAASLVTGTSYSKGSYSLRNKADSAWLAWATRDVSGSQAVYNLSNLGTVTATAFVGDGSGLTGISGGGGGSGTVTSVALSAPAFLSVAGSPVTTSGTLAVTLATQSANLVFAGPGSGSAAAPTFRALVAADIPSITLAKISDAGSAASQASSAFDAAGAAATVNTALSSHTGNTSNPHSTTAAQVGAYTTSAVDTALALKAPLASPTFTGTATAAIVTASKAITSGVVAGSYSSTFSTDASLGNQFDITLTGNITLANPTNPTSGQGLTWRLKQDGTGGRSVTQDTKFRDPGGVIAAMHKTANKAEYITAVYCLADDKWDVFGPGYAF